MYVQTITSVFEGLFLFTVTLNNVVDGLTRLPREMVDEVNSKSDFFTR